VPAGLDQSRWSRLWTRLGAQGDGGPVFLDLVEAYSEPARAYHTAAHIADCLDQLDLHQNLAQSPDQVEAALWFHDAIYVPLATDNEDRSAGLAETVLRAAGVRLEVARRVADLILTTRHTAIPQDPDARLLCDIDLSILGRDPSRFEQFEQQIRQEYARVPELLYRHGRSRILSGFLQRASIYQTPAFVAEYETQARRNLEGALVRLST